MDKQEFDILVVGAGAAGLMAALEIAGTGKQVAVIEAKEQAGGRIATIADNGRLLPLGAAFVHGNLPLTLQLLKEAGAQTYPIYGSIWQFKDNILEQLDKYIEDEDVLVAKFKEVKEDKSVAAFLQEDLAGEKNTNLRFSLRNYVEGYYAADTQKASTQALGRELAKEEEEQYGIESGYGLLIVYLEKKCREAGVQFFLGQPVLQLRWGKDAVTAVTKEKTLTGKKAMITVSIGVLQQEAISFLPELPAVKKAAQQLGFGQVMKVLLRFNTPFWKDKASTREKDLSDMSFLFSEEEIPTWWTHFPKSEAVLTGWLGGPRAEKFQHLSTDAIEAKAVAALSHLFNLPGDYLPQILERTYHYNWSADPHFGGAYSYEVVGGGEAIKELQLPIEDTLFFAGEGLHPGPQMGTVEGALQNGKEAAQRLLNHFTS